MEEREGDLFSDTSSQALAHCVSADLAMGRGIAVQFVERFGAVEELRKQKPDVGDVPYLKLQDGRFVFYIVTKKRYYDKPTYVTMRSALKTTRLLMDQLGVERIAIPAIGCGLDRLRWREVKKIVNEEWEGKKVTVYHYNK